MRALLSDWWGIGLGLLFCLASAFCNEARAQHSHHGNGHAERHDWYKELKQPLTGMSCCNAQTETNPDGDCRPTRAYLHADGAWRAMIDGKWTPIPPHVVLPSDMNKEGIYAHICASKYGIIHCFLPAGAGG